MTFYYLQQDKFYDVNYDTGDMSVQCGRKVDAFKAWFMIKARGEEYIEALVDNAYAQAEYLAEQVRRRPGFELVIDPISCTNGCFTFTPQGFRDGPVDPERLNKVYIKIVNSFASFKINLAKSYLLFGNYIKYELFAIPNMLKNVDLYL